MNSCQKDSLNYIEIDYSKDLVGIWTCLDPGYAEALVVNADGSVLSTGVEDNEYWEDVKGTVNVENNKIEMLFEDDDNFEGRFEIIPGEAFAIVDSKTGDRLIYRYCKQDISKEILGTWVCTDLGGETENDMLIQTFQTDGTVLLTGFSPVINDFLLNKQLKYKAIGDLIIQIAPEEDVDEGVPSYGVFRMSYTPDGTAYGDIMTFTNVGAIENETITVSIPWLRVKESLNLAGKKYDYIKTYISNVKGLDKDIPFMGETFNFSKMDGKIIDNFLTAVLFKVEFPNANTIKYSCYLDGENISMECPIEVDGNKMTVKMSERYSIYSDVNLYTYQDKDDTSMHMYMSTSAFKSIFTNMQVGMMIEQGVIDMNDTEAAAKVYNDIDTIIDSINISFVMSKSK